MGVTDAGRSSEDDNGPGVNDDGSLGGGDATSETPAVNNLLWFRERVKAGIQGMKPAAQSISGG